MLCSYLLKKLERFCKNISRIKYIYIPQMMEYKRYLRWKYGGHVTSIFFFRARYTSVHRDSRRIFFFCINPALIQITHQFPHFKRGIYDYFNCVRLECNFRKSNLPRVSMYAQSRSSRDDFPRTKMCKKYIQTLKAKSRNSRDGNPVVAINSNSCRETLFSHGLKKGRRNIFVYARLSGREWHGALSNSKSVTIVE